MLQQNRLIATQLTLPGLMLDTYILVLLPATNFDSELTLYWLHQDINLI